VISYGVSSYGYDVRVGRHFKVFTNVHTAIIDPRTSARMRSLILKLTSA